MTITKFIDIALDKLHSTFPQSELAYQYKPISNTHFIKISPVNLFSDDDFIDLDFELSDMFRNLDFKGSLCFLTEESLVQLDSPSIIISPNPCDTKGAQITQRLEPDDKFKGIKIGQLTFREPKFDYPDSLEAEDTKFAMAA